MRNDWRYFAGFYRTREPSTQEHIQTTLKALLNLQLGFFPLQFRKSRRETVSINRPEEFERSLIPKEFYIQGNTARIPFDAANGCYIHFTETTNPTVMPANFAIEFGPGLIEDGKMDTACLLILFRNVIAAFGPDDAYLCDRKHRNRKGYSDTRSGFDIREAPLTLFWINYYGPQWVKNIGKNRLQSIAPYLSALEWLDNGGVLFAIQNEPYDELNPKHAERQKELERKFDLEGLHRQYLRNSR